MSLTVTEIIAWSAEDQQKSLKTELSVAQSGNLATKKWKAIRETINSKVIATFWRKTLKTTDWFEVKSS